MGRRTLRAPTPVELMAKIYEANGWVRRAGESRTARAAALYKITIDAKRGQYVATPKPDQEEAR